MFQIPYIFCRVPNTFHSTATHPHYWYFIDIESIDQMGNNTIWSKKFWYLQKFLFFLFSATLWFRCNDCCLNSPPLPIAVNTTLLPVAAFILFVIFMNQYCNITTTTCCPSCPMTTPFCRPDLSKGVCFELSDPSCLGGCLFVSDFFWLCPCIAVLAYQSHGSLLWAGSIVSAWVAESFPVCWGDQPISGFAEWVSHTCKACLFSLEWFRWRHDATISHPEFALNDSSYKHSDCVLKPCTPSRTLLHIRESRER